MNKKPLKKLIKQPTKNPSILKSVDFTEAQKSRYLENETFFK